MNFLDSDLIVLYVLGKKEKLSGSKIYEEAKKSIECKDIRPASKATIFRSIKQLMKEGYLKEAGEKRVRGTLEKFYSLSEKGQSVYPVIRENMLFWEEIPHFRENCGECENIEIKECWEKNREKLEEVIKIVFGKQVTFFKTEKLKDLFKDPVKLKEFLFWLNMLKASKNMLKDKFSHQMDALNLQADVYFKA